MDVELAARQRHAHRGIDPAAPAQHRDRRAGARAAGQRLAGPALPDAQADRGAPSEARLWIGGIRSAEDYARVLRYFGSLDLVRQAGAVEARGDGVLMRVALTVGLPYFLSTVDTSATLTVVNGQPPVEGVDATLILGR